MSFEAVSRFESEVSSFFGAPYGVAVDCCTHGLELCLRQTQASSISVPKNTYISVPFLANKLDIQLNWREEDWVDYYFLTPEVVDAAVLWREDSYIPGTFMCLSFQFQKHLSLGRGGMILTDNKKAYECLKKMSYDGRIQDVPWREQDINLMGYHYYMTPETAEMGLGKLPHAIKNQPRQWTISDWPDLTQMEVFK
jgi:dTDP-4-amino-4,6-dideoxygalactose transaminase